MKTLRTTGLLALALALAPVAARAEVKLGFFDLQRAMDEIDDGRAAKTQLKREFEDKQKRLDLRQEEFKKAVADFEKQAVVMSDQAKRDRAGELERKQNELKEYYVQLQKELADRDRELTKGIFDKLNGVIREIAEAEGFTMIFEKNQAGLVYAPVSLDVTNEVIRKYNQRFGGAAKKPDAAPAKKADVKPSAKK